MSKLKLNSKALARLVILKAAIERIEGVSKRASGVDLDMIENALRGLKTLQNEIDNEWSVEGYLNEMGVSK